MIPSYNNARYLVQTIESVLSQSYPQVEIIVVDDGSTDDSVSLLRSYADRVRWFQQSNRGVSATRNRGIEASRGEFVAFLDSDDAWSPEKLTQQIERFRHPRVGMVYSGLQYIDEEGRPLGTQLRGSSGCVLRDLAQMRAPGVPATGSSAVVRRECLDRVGLFDEAMSYSADWDLWRRIACHYEIEIVREPLTLYRVHPSSMGRNIELLERDMLRALRSMFSDPAAREVYPMRRRCYGRLYLMLSGSYLHAGRQDRCAYYALRGLLAWPPTVLSLASFPLRFARRRLGIVPAG